MSFWYDVEEKQLFAQSLIGKLLVCDFDDPNHFAAPFGGFTTNEVILSVTASDYYTPTLNLYITQIGNDDLSQEYVDFPNPDLTVEVPNEIPNAFVGYEYPLFDAIAKDPYAGEFMPTVKVYSGYAFGLGVERITNLKYQVSDLRMFSENDVRFLHEFDAAN